jgi:hypothetical protein
MASYINVTFNHLSAIQRWATETGGSATLDMKDLTMEVKHRGRYYRMYPMFQGLVQGRVVHLPTLTPHVRGFGGWRPYTTITHPLSTDKQQFKAHLLQCGLRTPATWESLAQTPTLDYVVKARTGSFGQGIHGPFRAGTPVRIEPGEGEKRGAMFAEQFVAGHMLKVWFWGRRAFFAHMDPFPSITGDGHSTVEQLLRAKVSSSRQSFEEFDELPTIRACLAFHGLTLDSVLEAGRELWVEFRYGPRYPGSLGGTAVSDNALQPLAERTGTQLDDMGRMLADLLRPAFPLPVLITADAMLDAEGRIWWLEMNTNSIVPPEGYAAMFADLFA